MLRDVDLAKTDEHDLRAQVMICRFHIEGIFGLQQWIAPCAVRKGGEKFILATIGG